MIGESLIKGRATWAKWAASRQGLTKDDWALAWMNELTACGLPGPDYIVRAPNATLDGWLNRPAQYQDFSRALRLLLMVHGGETPDSVIEYSPHGCRHVQVMAGAQMASQGLLADASLECLGPWEKGVQDAWTVRLSNVRHIAPDAEDDLQCIAYWLAAGS